MKTLTRILAVIGGLVVLLAVLGWVSALTGAGEPKLGDRIVLTLDISDGFTGKRTGLLSQFMPREQGTAAIVRAIDRARRDTRVLGLITRFGGFDPALADAQELRSAIQRFKDSGKFAIAYAPSFGEGAGAVKSYYLASAYGEVWLQPVGLVGLNGLSYEMPFLRALLDRYGIQPEFVTRKAYKTAAANLTDKGMSPANAEQLNAMLDDISGQLISGIAEGRRLPDATVAALFGQGPFNTATALSHKLIDRVAYQDELLKHLKERAGKDARLTSLADYAHASDSDMPKALATAPDKHRRIAVINLQGPIHLGDSSRVTRNQTAGADTITSSIASAAEDKDIKAIVLRIDSPGGSPAASETIRRALHLAANGMGDTPGKPVIVSMGSLAASGGYWVASAAPYIVANPGTLTGSIGVVIGKVNIQKLAKDLGINFDGVSRGQNAGILSPARPFSAGERRTLESMADDVYADFIARVAESRKLDAKTVEGLAQGRVWTGNQALQNKLVDELGGLDLAVIRAKERIGLAADAPVYLETFPRQKSRLQQLMDIADYYQDLAASAPALGVQLESILAPGAVQAPLSGL